MSLLLSCWWQWIPEMMTLRSTAFPCSTLTYLESGNSGSPLTLNRLCFVTLMLRVWFWMSLWVSSWLGVSTLISESLSLAQANIDSLAPLPGLISGSAVPHNLLVLYSTATPASLGWGTTLSGLPLLSSCALSFPSGKWGDTGMTRQLWPEQIWLILCYI